MDLSLDGSVAGRKRSSGNDSILVSEQALCEPTQLWDLTGFDGFEPCLKILTPQLSEHAHERLRQFIRLASGFASLTDQFSIRLLCRGQGAEGLG